VRRAELEHVLLARIGQVSRVDGRVADRLRVWVAAHRDAAP